MAARGRGRAPALEVRLETIFAFIPEAIEGAFVDVDGVADFGGGGWTVLFGIDVD